MATSIPIVILAGSDRRPAEMPADGRHEHPLSGYKGVDIRIGGRSLVATVIDRLRDKWKKKYETENPIELLAYYGLQPIAPEPMWLPALRDFLEANWSSSPFHRVWVLDSWGSRILTEIGRPDDTPDSKA